MIFEMLLSVVGKISDILLLPFNIPNLPQETYSYIEQFFDYMEMGAGIFANYSPFAYLMTLLGIIITVDVAINLYHFVMWIVRKFPIASE